MPKKTSPKHYPTILILPLGLLAFVIVFAIYFLSTGTSLKAILTAKKELAEENVKSELAPVKIAELQVKAKKAQAVQLLLAEQVSKNETEDALKTAATLRGDVEDIWRDLTSFTDKSGAQEITQNITGVLTSEVSTLMTAQAKSSAANATKVKLELDLTKSLLNTVHPTVTPTSVVTIAPKKK